MQTDLENEIWEAVYRISNLTNCKDRKVGCIIYNTQMEMIVARGWNYHHNGSCDCDTTKTATHAEDMAITNIDPKYNNREDLILFVSHAPCKNCKSLIETRVKEVRYRSQK